MKKKKFNIDLTFFQKDYTVVMPSILLILFFRISLL